MAYPGADLLEFPKDGIHPTAYDQIENVRLMRDLMANPEAHFHHLLG